MVDVFGETPPFGSALLYGPGDTNWWSTPLDVAFALRGVHEDPIGSNRGPMVDVFLRHVGLDPTKGSYAWCTALVCYCLTMGGVSDDVLQRTAGVYDLWRKHRETYGVPVNSAKPGDVWVTFRKSEKTGLYLGHTGFLVRKVRRPNKVLRWREISGNTNEEGSREGHQVGVKARRRTDIKGVLRFPIERKSHVQASYA